MNLILRKRIILLIATSYALDSDFLWKCDEKIGDLEKLLNLLENNKLQEIKNLLDK